MGVHPGATGCHSSNTQHGSDKRWILSWSEPNDINAHCPGVADWTNQPGTNVDLPGCFTIWGRRMCLNAEKNLMYGPNGIVWQKRGVAAAVDISWRDASSCSAVQEETTDNTTVFPEDPPPFLSSNKNDGVMQLGMKSSEASLEEETGAH